MQYRKLIKGGADLSVLGYGCMRFPMVDGKIDEEKTESQLLLAFENGVNYYDTAYPYHGGKSEVILGDFVKKYDLRDRIYIADKMPTFLINKTEKINKYFDKQLDRLKMEYIDYYLMHTLDSLATWHKLKALGMVDFIEAKKKSGQIRHIGFSFHGRPEEFIKILEDYDWEFCQIQYNYLDEFNQAGLAGLKKAYDLGIGVVVMEPLRGGNLAAKAPTKVIDKFATYDTDRSPASWALRWVWNHKEVALLLSGMNVDEHILENISVASMTQPDHMSAEEIVIVDQAKEIYRELMKVPCTGCNYCMPCPYNVDIPGAFSDYNNRYFFDEKFHQTMYLSKVVGMVGSGKSGANLCTDCGKCEDHCPQNIEIRKELKILHKEMDSKIKRVGLRAAMLFMGKKNK